MFIGFYGHLMMSGPKSRKEGVAVLFVLLVLFGRHWAADCIEPDARREVAPGGMAHSGREDCHGARARGTPMASGNSLSTRNGGRGGARARLGACAISGGPAISAHG
jgi:hypothetical protein